MDLDGVPQCRFHVAIYRINALNTLKGEQILQTEDKINIFTISCILHMEITQANCLDPWHCSLLEHEPN